MSLCKLLDPTSLHPHILEEDAWSTGYVYTRKEFGHNSMTTTVEVPKHTPGMDHTLQLHVDICVLCGLTLEL